MADVQPINHLKDTFYTTSKLAFQMMTFKEWRETCKATEGHIVSMGETLELYATPRGGGMYEVRARQMYWRKGKPKKVVEEKADV